MQREFSEMKARIESVKYKQKKGGKGGRREDDLKKELMMVCS